MLASFQLLVSRVRPDALAPGANTLHPIEKYAGRCGHPQGAPTTSAYPLLCSRLVARSTKRAPGANALVRGQNVRKVYHPSCGAA